MDDAPGFLLPARPLTALDEYRALGGGAGIEHARRVGPEAVVDEVRRSGLRGRGGAGFPTGIKWRGAKVDPDRPKYLVCNAAEGEPGTFKDRMLIRRNPYQLLEGIAIAAETLAVAEVFIGIKERFSLETAVLQRAAAEMTDAGMIAQAPLTIVAGPDDYLFGEEKALLEVIEGNDPLPRVVPPYVRGLFTPQGQPGNPTVVNNVETLSNIPHIVAKGADWYRSFGTERSPGTMVFTVSGDVREEGVVEFPMGTPLSMLVYLAGGGFEAGRRAKAVVSGASNRPLPVGVIDTPMDFESMQAAGGALGAGGMIVYDDTASMVEAAAVLTRFLADSSCGQCPPCKLGTTSMAERLDELLVGTATVEQLEMLGAWTSRVTDSNRCGLGSGASALVGGFLEVFWDEFAARVGATEPIERRLRLPKLTDYDEQKRRFVYG